jgi:hypothetical protein
MLCILLNSSLSDLFRFLILTTAPHLHLQKRKTSKPPQTPERILYFCYESIQLTTTMTPFIIQPPHINHSSNSLIEN